MSLEPYYNPATHAIEFMEVAMGDSPAAGSQEVVDLREVYLDFRVTFWVPKRAGIDGLEALRANGERILSIPETAKWPYDQKLVEYKGWGLVGGRDETDAGQRDAAIKEARDALDVATRALRIASGEQS